MNQKQPSDVLKSRGYITVCTAAVVFFISTFLNEFGIEHDPNALYGLMGLFLVNVLGYKGQDIRNAGGLPSVAFEATELVDGLVMSTAMPEPVEAVDG